MGKMSRLREALYGFVERPSLIHVRRGSPFAASLAKIGAGQQLSIWTKSRLSPLMRRHRNSLRQ